MSARRFSRFDVAAVLLRDWRVVAGIWLAYTIGVFASLGHFRR